METNTSVKSVSTWVRFTYMLLFLFALNLVAAILPFLVLLQFLSVILSGEPNRVTAHFCGSLAQYVASALRFLTYNSEEKPFPFTDWPSPKEQ